MTNAEIEAEFSGVEFPDNYSPFGNSTMNDSPAWLDTVNQLGQTAAGIANAFRRNNSPSTAQRTVAPKSPTWLPIAIIGGVVLVVVGLVVALRK
jgi:hypothetical protein